MVVTLLLVLAATTGTGMVTLAVCEGEGPLAPFMATAAPSHAAADSTIGAAARALAPIRPARADGEDEGRAGAEPGREIKELLEVLANLALVLVLAHIAEVALASFAHRENLPRAM